MECGRWYFWGSAASRPKSQSEGQESEFCDNGSGAMTAGVVSAGPAPRKLKKMQAGIRLGVPDLSRLELYLQAIGCD